MGRVCLPLPPPPAAFPFAHPLLPCPYYQPPQVVRFRPLLSPEEFQRRKDYHDYMIQQAKRYQNVPREIKSRWTSTKDDRMKLNTDGSSRGNPGPSSYGGLIRKGKEWVCGYMGRINGKSCTSLEAEVMGIYHGLCLIRDRGLTNVLIETDCESVVMMISGKVEKYQTLKTVLADIFELLTQQKCGLCHTRRDGNQCADLMAKLGGSQIKEHVVLDKPPTLLLPYLERDRIAAKEFDDLNKPKERF